MLNNLDYYEEKRYYELCDHGLDENDAEVIASCEANIIRNYVLIKRAAYYDSMVPLTDLYKNVVQQYNDMMHPEPSWNDIHKSEVWDEYAEDMRKEAM